MKQTSINTILFLLLGISIFFGYRFYKNNSLLTLKVNSISNALSEKNLAKKDSIINVIEFQKTKEEYYTTQLSIQSDWIIGYVTLLFGIIGFTYYQNSIKEIKENFENLLIKYKEDSNTLYVEHKKELIEIEKTLYISYAEAQRATSFTDVGSILKFMYFLGAAYYFGKAFHLEVNGEVKERLIKFLLNNINFAHESLKKSEQNADNIKVLKQEIKHINKKLFEISKFENEEVREVCAKIQVLVSAFGTK